MANEEHKYNKDRFEPIEMSEEKGEELSRPQLSYLQDSWIRLKKNKGAIIGLLILLFIGFMAIFGPYMNDYTFKEQDSNITNVPPRVQGLENISWLGLDGKETEILEGESVEALKEKALYVFETEPEFLETNVIKEASGDEMAEVEFTNDIYAARGIQDEYYWFGTDQLGRDLWTRTWSGTRISLYIAILAALIDMVIGVVYGGVSAYYGGRVDNYMQRIVEILVGIPNLVVVILMILVLEPGILSITIALTITGWIGMARVIRGNVLKLKNQEFVLASRTLGSSDSRILMKHLVPNVTGLIIINTMFTIPGAIFFEAFLSFIGLGLQPPLASLGTLIDDAFKSFQIYPYMLVFPSVIISLIMVAFNVLADGLRDALDPKMRE
ncbi:ABC transporter permease subunit [Pontibacillus yanchengensis]|uniref:ABC transporter permease subunit n=2 Tax=Pontibacillus yanchengensis TaxID=462910 RepID=A0ACC7VDF5_9BACI|nr:oligopeptide ABC transporter permease [Pontibacillus yanchengensis]MYL32232.1 ABC transporter permease subunit [Pontibacillus yanchengensis]MYL52812.1 ABC transporter permease subunit [Pontibacillus yanchengensis]